MRISGILGDADSVLLYCFCKEWLLSVCVQPLFAGHSHPIFIYPFTIRAIVVWAKNTEKIPKKRVSKKICRLKKNLTHKSPVEQRLSSEFLPRQIAIRPFLSWWIYSANNILKYISDFSRFSLNGHRDYQVIPKMKSTFCASISVSGDDSIR